MAHWGVSSSAGDEFEYVCAQMRVLVEAEEDQRRRHALAVAEVKEAAGVAAAVFRGLAAGPGAFEVPVVSGPITSVDSVQALAAGVLAAGLLGQAAADKADGLAVGDGDLLPTAGAVRELYGLYGDDPVFFQGLMGEQDSTADFLEFLDRCSRSHDTGLRALAAAMAASAKDALPKWTKDLPAAEQEQVGRDLINAVNHRRGGQGVFASYLLTGGPPERVVFGSLMALEGLARRVPPPVWESWERQEALATLGVAEPGDELWLAGAVFTQVAAHPKLALNYLAPADHDLAMDRAALWFDQDRGPEEVACEMADRGTGLYTAVLSAVSYGSQMDYGSAQQRAARLMGDITTLLGNETDGYPSAALGHQATTALTLAYTPYLDGIGLSLNDTAWDSQNGQLLDYSVSGFDAKTGLDKLAMPAFSKAELVSVIEGLSASQEDRDVWDGVLAGHMRTTGHLAENLTTDQREISFRFAGENVSAVWGKVDHTELDAREKTDKQIADGIDSIAKLVKLPAKVPTPLSIAFKVGVNQGAGWLTDQFMLADEVREAIYSDYPARSELLAAEYMHGARQAGIGPQTGTAKAFYEQVMPTTHGVSVMEDATRDFQDKMIASRDREEGS